MAVAAAAMFGGNVLQGLMNWGMQKDVNAQQFGYNTQLINQQIKGQMAVNAVNYQNLANYQQTMARSSGAPAYMFGGMSSGMTPNIGGYHVMNTGGGANFMTGNFAWTMPVGGISGYTGQGRAPSTADVGTQMGGMTASTGTNPIEHQD